MLVALKLLQSLGINAAGECDKERFKIALIRDPTSGQTPRMTRGWGREEVGSTPAEASQCKKQQKLR